ncbi:MAG: glycine cleavage system aminomethyltransferase GcvT [Elusimicrobia bacterium]|nr:glycine cleavage system aminomethyltransferase GcvT [Elusimicrobiota bacterium]MBU2614188.1 glycine cleavage system aminomethyltransferase GcvT [Elusimicrobiota bacterium]
MGELKKTVFYDKHAALKANMVEFGGWRMPLQYESGIVNEHLLTRKSAGLFDVSHMGRFVFKGAGAVPFLQHVLTNNAAALEVRQAQYTIIPNETGGAIDDSYLYRFTAGEYLLVVNASNLQKDWDYFKEQLKKFTDVEMLNKSEDIAMISLQGPESENILAAILESGQLPGTQRNLLSIVNIKGSEILLARTGYTGEPICFELFVKRNDALKIWDLLLERGAAPIGLGARDTLRLEAGLPLYGHEFGIDIEGKEIPILSSPLVKFAVRNDLLKQITPPRLTRCITLIDKGVARAGYKIFFSGKHAGYITSGTTVPYYKVKNSRLVEEKMMRSIGLALVDNTLREGDIVEVEVRDKKIKAKIVPRHLITNKPPYAIPVI